MPWSMIPMQLKGSGAGSHAVWGATVELNRIIARPRWKTLWKPFQHIPTVQWIACWKMIFVLADDPVGQC